MGNTKSNKENENTTRFNVTVDQIPYQVDVLPFQFNNDSRFSITINNGSRGIFAWDSEMKMYRGLDDQSSILPDGLMVEINKKFIRNQQIKKEIILNGIVFEK